MSLVRIGGLCLIWHRVSHPISMPLVSCPILHAHRPITDRVHVRSLHRRRRRDVEAVGGTGPGPEERLLAPKNEIGSDLDRSPTVEN